MRHILEPATCAHDGGSFSAVPGEGPDRCLMCGAEVIVVRAPRLTDDDLAALERLVDGEGGPPLEVPVSRAWLSRLVREVRASRRGGRLPVVHVLEHGFALCGAGMCSKWQHGDRWVRRDEPGATCAGCLDAARRHA